MSSSARARQRQIALREADHVPLTVTRPAGGWFPHQLTLTDPRRPSGALGRQQPCLSAVRQRQGLQLDQAAPAHVQPGDVERLSSLLRGDGGKLRQHRVDELLKICLIVRERPVLQTHQQPPCEARSWKSLSLSKTRIAATPGTFARSGPVSQHQDQPPTATPGLAPPRPRTRERCTSTRPVADSGNVTLSRPTSA